MHRCACVRPKILCMSATVEPLVTEHPSDRPARGSAQRELANVFDALSDPIRLQIVQQLADGLEHSCGSFGLPIAKSTCSHHLRVLRGAGVIDTRIDGTNRLNRLRRDALDARFPGLIDAILRATRA